jgi:hypothetical protein
MIRSTPNASRSSVYAAPVRASDEPEPAEDDVAADDVGLDDKVAWAVPVAGFWVVP